VKQTDSKELIDWARKLTLTRPNLSIVPDTDDYPWLIRELQRQLQVLESRRELLLPNLMDDNETIAIFSDYGGESSKSRYHTYGFLICAWNQLHAFNSVMHELREKTGLNSPFKEIAFKDLRYGPIRRALADYLAHLSNLVNGFLLTVVVEKAAGPLFAVQGKTKEELTQLLSDQGFGSWKPAVAEKVLRVTHLAAYLIALLSRDGQKVVWMTDHDAIAPSEPSFMATLRLFSQLLSHYCPHSPSALGGAFPIEEGTGTYVDLLSAPDLVAGAVEQYFTRARENSELAPSESAQSVLRWLSGQGIALKRHVMMIRREDGGVIGARISFGRPEGHPDEMFVPVLLP
jgi:hypothetical protein